MTPSPLSISALAPHPPLRRYYANEQAKAGFVRRIFDAGAGDYDRVERLMALGSGSWYRRMALQRAGLAAGMRVLDVAIGTGLVAREEVAIVGSPQLVLGLDPSVGMVQEAVQHLGLPVIIGRAERLPLGDELFDFLSMGYALRHISDLRSAFGEFRRVLKPGGTLCILEITRPRKEWTAAILRQYMLRIVPALARLMGRAAQSVRLWEYFWDTIEACVPAEQVMAALTSAGFVRVRREKNMGFFRSTSRSVSDLSLYDRHGKSATVNPLAALSSAYRVS